MAEQRIEAEPVPSNLQLPTDPLPGLVAQRAEKISAFTGQMVDDGLRYLDAVSARDAQKDAAQLVNDIGKGVVQPPASFKPPGFQTRSYATNFETQATALYTSQQAQKYSEFASQTAAANPSDPATVTKLLNDKANEMLSVMGAEYKPFLELRFNAIAGQHVTQVTNNFSNANAKEMLFRAQQSADTLAEDMARSAGWSGRIDPAGLDASAKLLKDRWNIETRPLLEAAKMTPAAIENWWTRTQEKAFSRRVMMQYQNINLLTETQTVKDANGVERQVQITRIDPNALKAALNSIKGVGAGHPNAAQLEQAAQQGLQNAVRYAQIGQQQWEQEQSDMRTVRMRDELALRETYRQNPQETGLSFEQMAAAIQKANNESRMDIINSTRASPQTQIQMLADNQQIHNMNAADNQQYFSSQIIKLGAQAHDLEQPMHIREAAVRQIEGALADPTVLSTMSPQIQAHATGIVNEFHKRAVSNDVMSVAAQIQAGGLSEQQIDAYTTKFKDKGWIGPDGIVQDGQWHQMAANGKIAYLQQQQALESAANGQTTFRTTGALPNEQQTKNLALAKPFEKMYLGGKPFNMQDPTHQSAVIQRFTTDGIVDPQVKQAMETGPRSTPEQAQAFANIYQGLASQLTLPYSTPASVHAMVSKLIGNVPAQFAVQVNRDGPVNAIKTFNERTTSEARNLGKSDGATNAQAPGSLQKFLSNTSELQSIIGLSDISQAFGTAQSPFAKTISQMRDAGRSNTYSPTGSPYRGVVVEDPTVEAALTSDWKEHLTQFGVPAEQASGQAQTEGWAKAFARRSGDLEIAVHPEDSSKLVVRWKTGQAILADKYQVKPNQVPEGEVAGFASGLIIAHAHLHGAEPAANIDYSRARMATRVDENGFKNIDVIAPVNTSTFGNFVSWVSGNRFMKGDETVLASFAADDPIFDAMTKKISQFASQEVRSLMPNWPKAPNTEGMTMGERASVLTGYRLQQLGNVIKEPLSWLVADPTRMVYRRAAVEGARPAPDFTQHPIDWMAHASAPATNVYSGAINEYVDARKAENAQITEQLRNQREYANALFQSQRAARMAPQGSFNPAP